MDTTRRTFLKSGLLTGTLGLNLNATSKQPINDPTCGPATGGKRFNFKNEPPRIRKSFYDLSDDEVKNLCRAVGYMRKDIALNSTLQWENYAKLHAYHCTNSGVSMVQVHWSWHFLPWHRGYVYFLERILDNILKTNFGWNGDAFAYPYWDWSNHQEIPNTKLRKDSGLASPLFGYDLTQEDMVQADSLGFDNLALYDGNRKPSILQPTMDPSNEVSADSKQHITETKWYMSRDYINAILQAPFELFGGKAVENPTTPSGQGLLEQGPHNNGHDWVGTRFGNNRNMGTLRYAANDPIFFMHHGNIDRIWSLYKNEMPDPNGPWGQQEYTYTDIDGSPLKVTVKDIVTKLTNITYQPPSDEPIKLTSTVVKTIPKSVTIPVSGELTKDGLVLDISENQQLKDLLSVDSKLSIFTVETGPISYAGKFNISVYVNQTNYIGRINVLDGRVPDTNLNAAHEFPMTIGIGQQSLTNNLNTSLSGYPKSIKLVLSKVQNKNFKLNIKSLKFTVLR